MQRRLEETQAQAGGLGGASQAVANEVKKIESTLTSRAPVRFLGIDVAGEKRAAAEVVNTAKTTASQVQQATTKFDSTAFWARQGMAATEAARTTETEAKRVVSAVESSATSAGRATTRVTSTVIRDAKTGATLTQAELRKIISGGSKAVEDEAKKVGQGTGSILNDLRKLFLQNNFLFRQLGQRAAGDLGFAAVGVGKLALNFQQLAAASGGAGAELGGAVSAATGALGVFGPLGIAVAVAAAGVVALTVATVGAAAGLFLLSKSVSDTEEHFADLHQQTGLSVENLQLLDIAGRRSHTTVDRLQSSVGQLERKLIDASEGGTSRFSRGLKKLGIDLEDPNKALNQIVDLLAKLPAGTVRTGAAIQIFGRAGKDAAGAIGELVDQVGNADGVLERFRAKQEGKGIHILTPEEIKLAEDFNTKLKDVTDQILSVVHVASVEALPVVLDVVTRLSNAVSRNKDLIGDWAKEFVHVAEKVVSLAIEIGKLANLIMSINPIVLTVKIQRVISGAILPVASEIVSGIGEAVSRPPTLPGSRFSPVTRGQGVITVTPQVPGRRAFTFDPSRPEFSFTPTASKVESPEDIAKRIRDAFAQTRGGGGRGEDPAQTARRLAEIALQETLKGLDAEHQALDRQLDLNRLSRERYTQDAINLELRRRQATLDGLKKELAEAENIRKPGQRAIRVAEINARIVEEERRSAKEVEHITDERAAEQLRIGQATAQSQLRIIETQTEQVKARIRDYANFRIITERQAAQWEENQTLRVFNARERILQQELRDAGDNEEKQEEARNKLRELDAERAAFIEESGRRIEAAIRADAEHVVEFAAQIRDAFQRAADVRLEAKEAGLEPLRNSLLTRHQLWDAELQFEITREEQRHRATIKQLQDEATLARIRIKNENELEATLREIRARGQAEQELHQARLQQLATQAAEQRRQEMLQVADDISSIASDIFDAIGKSSDEFWKSLKQSATNFAKQLRDELFKGLLEKLITGQAQGTTGLVGLIVNPLLKATGPNAAVVDNTKATHDNTAAINALTRAIGGTPAIPSLSGNLSGVLQFFPGLFGGGRASGGPAEAGKVYRVHENEVFFRPDISGQIINLSKLQELNGQRDELRVNVAVGQDAVNELIESHMRTPKGRRAALLRAKANRKVGRLLFA